MTRQRRLKQRARTYARATGASYSAARAAVAAGVHRSDGGASEKLEATGMSAHIPPPTSRPPDGALVTGVRPFFVVTSMIAAVEYYRDRLGFEPEVTGGDFFAIVRRGPVRIHLKQVAPEVPPVPNHSRHPDARHDAFISTPDPDALYEEALARGATVHRGLEDTSDGLRAFEVRDLDGYVLCFGRPR
jgi:hypothetical protein